MPLSLYLCFSFWSLEKLKSNQESWHQKDIQCILMQSWCTKRLFNPSCNSWCSLIAEELSRIVNFSKLFSLNAHPLFWISCFGCLNRNAFTKINCYNKESYYFEQFYILYRIFYNIIDSKFDITYQFDFITSIDDKNRKWSWIKI